VTPELGEYIRSVSLREPEILKRLRDETAAIPEASMQLMAEQGQFLAFLARLMGAKRTLEVGVFTGYSSLVTALALPEDGRIVACDVSEEWTSIARRYWKEAGVDHKIDLRLGPALDTLRGLLGEGRRGSFDFAFIDADKQNYDGYFDLAMELVRPGGVIAADNVLWDGSVVDAGDQSESTVAIRAFNMKVFADERVWISLAPIGDGLMLALKK
jgi:predicted O-methyltransferase YrrM